jgi:prophage antirepressor-like protein
MSELVFNFRDSIQRVFTTAEGKDLYVGSEVCRNLGREDNFARTIKTYVKSKWWIEYPNPNGGKPILCLFEPGVYQLASNPIFDSEWAEIFQDFMFEVMIPKLRAEGYYTMPSATVQQLEKMISEGEARIRVLEGRNELLEIQKEAFTELNGTTIEEFRRNVKRGVTPSPKFNADDFDVRVEEILYGMGAKTWQVEISDKRLSKPTYRLDDLIEASRRFLKERNPKALPAFDNVFKPFRGQGWGEPVETTKSLLDKWLAG